MTVPLSGMQTLPFTPASLVDRRPPISFSIRIPTYADRDVIGTRLYRLGLNDVTQEQIQAQIVSSLFDLAIEAAGMNGDHAAAEAKAEETAMFLENFWNQSKLDEHDIQAWAAQERERLLDIKAGADAPPPEREPMPPRRTTVRQRSQVPLIVQDVVNRCAKVRALLADQQLYQVRYRDAMVRTHVVGVNGLDVPLVSADNALTPDTIERLRGQLAQFSHTAYDELFDHINLLYELPETERGNSDSPPENISVAAHGSTQAIDASAEADGKWTASSIEPAPVDASPAITGTSSVSSPDAASNTAQSDGPTIDP